jgi:gamma-tubulin complex component 5
LLEEPLIVSLLETQNSLSDEFDTAFAVIHEIVQNVFDISEDADNGVQVVQTKRSPAVHSTLLLDTLFSTLQEHAERNSAVVSRMLMRVFVRTAEPIWAMVGKWLRDGMNIRSGEHGEKSSDLDEEFFIESSGVGIGMMSMGLFDPDFWTEGYCLRDQLVPSGAVGEDWENARQRLVPSFLDHIADPILGTGKAIGLARVLGLSQPSQGLSKWLSFADVIYSSLNGEHGDETASQKDRLSALFSVSVDSLSRIVYDWLWPVCEATGDWVVNIIVDDCEFWRHMSAIEDLFLMRRGDALSHLIDLVFLKVRMCLRVCS